MKRLLKHAYNLFRLLAVTAIVLPLVLFAAVYVALKLPPVQDALRQRGEAELSELLHTKVTIGDVSIAPFNQLVLHDVAVCDQQGDSLLRVATLGAGVSLSDMFTEERLVFTYGEIIGLKANIRRATADSVTNAQFLIDIFRPKPGQPPKPYDLAIRNIVIRQSEVTYDVLDRPAAASGRFDPNHIAVSNLRADISLPRLKNNDFDIDVKRLSLRERSGLALDALSAHALVGWQELRLDNVEVRLPHSQLLLEPFALQYDSLPALGRQLPSLPFAVATRSGTAVTPADLAPFYPPLASLTTPVTIDLKGEGQGGMLRLERLHLRGTDGLRLDVSGTASDVANDQRRHVELPSLVFHCDAAAARRLATLATDLSPQAHQLLDRCGATDLDASLTLNGHHLTTVGTLATALGKVACDMTMDMPVGGRPLVIAGQVATENLAIGQIVNRPDLLGLLAMHADVDASIAGKTVEGDVAAIVDYIDFRGRRYDNITADITSHGGTIDGTLHIDDDDVQVAFDGEATLAGADTRVDANIVVSQLRPADFGVGGKLADHTFQFNMDASFTGNRLDNATGEVHVQDFAMTDAAGNGLRLEHLDVTADNASAVQRIDISSDYLTGSVEGSFDFATLVPAVRRLLGRSMPTLFGSHTEGTAFAANDFDFSFELYAAEPWQQWLHLPVRLVDRATVSGHFSEPNESMRVNVSAPYLLQGNKIIEGVAVDAALDRLSHQLSLRAQAIVPTKESRLALTADLTGLGDVAGAHLAWRLLRDRDFHGDLDLCARLGRDDNHRLTADVDLNPSVLVFNDTAWQVSPGHFAYDGTVLTVDSLVGRCDKQFVLISGAASHNPEDELLLDLNDISLDYVFETLNIDHVNFGGRATGRFYAADLFSGLPRLSTPGLHVEALNYNHTLMGDADIRSQWLNDEKAVTLYADISQRNGLHSIIDGAIFVADDSLYLDFDTHRANVGFLRPYMAAFTSDVSGEVSGHAVLFGNFKTINLKGDVVADSLRFKLDYTNVYYTCAGDSVHIVPDHIAFDGVRLHDRDGHEGIFSGWLDHNSFHDPKFRFEITGARDLLCYDTDARLNPRWYGTVYGNGAAFVSGEPGYVEIRVNMETAPRSRFTFVLSDAEQAVETKFITFTDRDRLAAEAAEAARPAESDSVPEIVRQLRARVAKQEQDVPTRFNIELQGDITPAAQLVLVMDPIGGDQIKATGGGNMRLTYNDNDEMAIYGTYTLEKGNYNFTLQDIIIKEFSIADGSKLTFKGDPYAAEMDIEAVYSLTANLADLDESFATDREITRTNVPVQALMRADGPISQPEISFDLHFPTLTTDIDRKVKSIISTDDMMNRQIIYLLALNRFYTPEYTSATTRNNELSSVASSTISSQLSNILGKMSDNWTIAPNFRTDRGDFSDVEVNLALSSQLLNNRLLFNGNFGYRDNTYNTSGSNFIGDFDIEYLLNPRGTLRLKAYNHFNDQNYYVRNALTTQGLGIVWKHDFDRKARVPRPQPAMASPVDSVAVRSDSVP